MHCWVPQLCHGDLQMMNLDKSTESLYSLASGRERSDRVEKTVRVINFGFFLENKITKHCHVTKALVQLCVQAYPVTWWNLTSSQSTLILSRIELALSV
jgi:hypothetical protein